MSVMIGGERVARLTDLRRSAKSLIDQLKAAKNQQESRVVLTTHGEPVAVLQEYSAYQKMLNLLEETQRKLHIAEVRDRLRLLNEGKMGTVPLEEVIARYPPADSDVSD
jgi:PHD/YefM family antitoxin component YafN of YafNO toxin-antitoxin module